MKNWCRIIDLGDVECVVRREGGETICIDFWLLEEDSLISTSVKMDQPYWLIDALFDGDHEPELAQLARKALATVQTVDDSLEEVESGRKYSFTGPSLDLLAPPPGPEST